MKEIPKFNKTTSHESNSWKEEVELHLSEKLEELDNAKTGTKVQIGFTTLNEFRLLLETCELPKEKIEEILAHENAHANKIDSLGIKGVRHAGYKLYIEKDGEDYIVSDPSTIISEPLKYKLFFRKKRKQYLKDVLLAPKEYGEELSESDIEKLKKL